MNENGSTISIRNQCHYLLSPRRGSAHTVGVYKERDVNRIIMEDTVAEVGSKYV